jgi:hypothetical protein
MEGLQMLMALTSKPRPVPKPVVYEEKPKKVCSQMSSAYLCSQYA